MDYDDKVYQGQNSHIDGEESSKFSPVSHPYALPKFDFDEGLQGHLRFDNLVENEGFLAIPSQEDNQWIEDFSRGSGGLVFSSSAPEPCPSLRSNNVWSEAASSESVEMLLKSVGQEETVAVVEESDACQKLGRVAEQMESRIKEDDKTMNDMVSDLTLLSEKVADHNIVLNDVKGVPNSPGVEISTHKGSHVLNPNALNKTCGVDKDEDNLDRKLGEDNLIEVDASLSKSHVSGMQDPSGSNMHTEVEDSISQDIIVKTICLGNQESTTMITDVGSESASCLLTVSVKEVEEDVFTKKVQIDDGNLKGVGFGTPNENLENLLCSSSKSEVVELRPVEIIDNKLEEPSSFTVIGSSDIQIAEECDEDVFDSQTNKGSGGELINLSNMAQIHQQMHENIQDNLTKKIQGAGDLVAYVTEVSTGKAEAEVINCPGEGEVRLQGSESQLLTEISISNKKATMSSNLDNNVSNPQEDGTSISVVEHPSVTSTCFATSIQEKEYSAQKMKFGDDASGNQKDSSAEDLVSSPTMSSLASNLDNIHRDHVVSSNGEENPIVPNVSSEMDHEIIEPRNLEKGVGLSSDGESSKLINEAVHGSERDVAGRIEPDVTEEAPPSLYERGADYDLAADQTRENMKIKETCSVETNLIPLKEISKSTDKMDPVFESDKGSALNLTEELSQEAADHSLQVVGTSNTATEIKQTGVITNVTAGRSSPVAEIPNSEVKAEQAEKPYQISESFSPSLDLFTSICDPTSKQNNVADESATPANHGAIEKDHKVASSEVSDSDVRTPSISSFNVLNESKDEKEKMVDKSLFKSVPPAGSVESAFKDAKQSDVAKDGKNFTFEVHPSGGAVGESGKDKQFFPITESFKSFKEASPLTPSIGPMEPRTVVDSSRVSSQAFDPKIVHGGSTGTPVRKRGRPPAKTPKSVLKPSPVSSQVFDVEVANGGSTGTPARKRGRPSGKTPGKLIAKNGSSLKETTPFVKSERGDNKSIVSTSLTGTGKLQFEEVKLHEKAKHSTIESHAGVLVATPNLPDLNTSASPSALVRQPFSDIQQMQLRAQIFVYGSLIQGAAPDETCMVAAFGTSDGGRNMWEPVWRACVEKLQGAKSNPSKSENPLQPQSGSNLPERSSTKKDALQSSVLLPPVGRASFKGTPSPVVNPMIPLSSPLWNVSTPFHGLQSPGIPRSSVFDYRQTLSPSHPFQTPPSRNVTVNNSSWPSHASSLAPWITASQSSPFDPSACLPTTETLKLTPIKESVPPVASVAKHSFPSATVHHSRTNVSVEPYPLPVMIQSSVPSGQKTFEPKTRKRKKSSVSENLIPIPLPSQARMESVPAFVPLLSQTQREQVPALVVPSHLSTSVVVSTPFFGSKGNDAKIVTTASPTYLADKPKRVEANIEQMSCLPDDAMIKDEETKQQAEDAANSAASAVSHRQTVWDQLNKQKIVGLMPEDEAKLASAAVAVGAAVDVANAAAAAAHVASNAASQAKMLFDEAWISSRVDNPSFSSASLISNMGNSMGLVTTSSSTFNGDEGNSSSSILCAAKEADRKKVESASFASKLAENLDAVLKAAELVAAAASQVGIIVAMADPPSLVKLVEAGPESYWRISQAPPEQVNEECSNIGIVHESSNVSGRQANDEPTKKKVKSTSRGMFPLSKEVFKDSVEDHVKRVEDIPAFFTSSEKDSNARRDFRASDLDTTIGVVPESESGARLTLITSQDDYNNCVDTLEGGTRIKEGCLVEVKKEGSRFKEAWFSANVLSMENGKAFVSYNGSKSGSKELKEWVPLEGDGDNEPRIRIAQADKQFEGTRKRRRGEVGDCVWSVGDKVDVWMRECWREGVVTDKNKIDSTTLTAHFPAEGETSVVRAWHLRPTLLWKDGKWIESSSLKQKDPLYKGDTPQQKRLKLGGPSMEGSKKDSFQLPEPERPEKLQLLPLSNKEKMFNVGNDTKKDNKLDAPRTVRSGLQKEGPRVVFGVPKPGKKKKFMEVSKHYVDESSNKTNKLREMHMMPKNDAKIKQQGELKTRIPKPGKTISSFGRTLPQKDKFSNSRIPSKNEAKKSTSTDGSEPEQQKRSEFRSVLSTDRVAQGSFVFSSSALPRNTFTSNTRSERAKRENRTPIVGRWAKGEGKDNIDSGKQNSDVSEPRRSNRRIQPTTRLLEGLQSSLILPKFPSFAHDKGQRSHSRSTPKGK